MVKIILASGSPRRQELLGRIGVKDFEVVVPQVEETYPAGLNPEETVCYISREKSDAAARLCAADDIIITADTMVFLDDKRLGKPHGEEEALAMLTALAGRHHTVCTGVTVRRGETVLTRAQALALRRFIHANDPHAFMVITASTEIVGKGFLAS